MSSEWWVWLPTSSPEVVGVVEVWRRANRKRGECRCGLVRGYGLTSVACPKILVRVDKSVEIGRVGLGSIRGAGARSNGIWRSMFDAGRSRPREVPDGKAVPADRAALVSSHHVCPPGGSKHWHRPGRLVAQFRGQGSYSSVEVLSRWRRGSGGGRAVG